MRPYEGCGRGSSPRGPAKHQTWLYLKSSMATFRRTIRIIPPKEFHMTPEEVTKMIAEILRQVRSVDREPSENGNTYFFRGVDGHILKEIHESKPIHPLWREAIRRVDEKISSTQKASKKPKIPRKKTSNPSKRKTRVKKKQA